MHTLGVHLSVYGRLALIDKWTDDWVWRPNVHLSSWLAFSNTIPEQFNVVVGVRWMAFWFSRLLHLWDLSALIPFFPSLCCSACRCHCKRCIAFRDRLHIGAAAIIIRLCCVTTSYLWLLSCFYICILDRCVCHICRFACSRGRSKRFRVLASNLTDFCWVCLLKYVLTH